MKSFTPIDWAKVTFPTKALKVLTKQTGPEKWEEYTEEYTIWNVSDDSALVSLVNGRTTKIMNASDFVKLTDASKPKNQKREPSESHVQLAHNVTIYYDGKPVMRTTATSECPRSKAGVIKLFREIMDRENGINLPDHEVLGNFSPA